MTARDDASSTRAQIVLKENSDLDIYAIHILNGRKKLRFFLGRWLLSYISDNMTRVRLDSGRGAKIAEVPLDQR